MEPDYFYPSDPEAEDTFQNLSESDYGKVIFYDLYSNTDNTVGCRFQITDNVHEDPQDYIGLFRVGYDNLSQCLASKMLSQTECEEDGKLLRCTFKPSELPELENGFYQFVYVTRDKEVCGASTPFQIQNSTKDSGSDEDVVADNSEDDFLVVRSNIADKNRRLQEHLTRLTEKYETEMKQCHLKLKVVNEEKLKLEHCLKKACEEKVELYSETQRIIEEKNVLCTEKEEAIRILKEKNKVFSSMFDNYSEKLKEFTELKLALEADKNLQIAENEKLLDRIQKLKKDLQNEQKKLEREKEKNHELVLSMRKETSVLTSQLDDAKLMIEALEKSKQLSLNDLASLTEEVANLKEKLNKVKCENLILESRLSEALKAHKKIKEKEHSMLSEMAALKIHIIELHESKHPRKKSVVCDSKEKQAPCSSKVNENECKSSKFLEHPRKKSVVCDSMEKQAPCSSKMNENECKSSKFLEESIQTDQNNEEFQNLKIHCDELNSELEEKNATIAKLKEEIVKSNGVVEYLTKEKDSIQKIESVKQQALDECILRLNEASELYKKQFRKIEKLKKKLNKSSTDFMEKSSCASVSIKNPCSSLADGADSSDEAVLSVVQLSQNQNSDSDTGEHVLRHPLKVEKQQCPAIHEAEVYVSPTSLSASAAKDPSCSKIREVPELQTLIEMNLEKLKNSKSKEEEKVLYSIPCPVCDQDIGVYMSSTDEMIKHLEVQHKQQLCPVCGRLFDMNLPPKYFVFHVEDHFKK